MMKSRQRVSMSVKCAAIIFYLSTPWHVSKLPILEKDFFMNLPVYLSLVSCVCTITVVFIAWLERIRYEHNLANSNKDLKYISKKLDDANHVIERITQINHNLACRKPIESVFGYQCCVITGGDGVYYSKILPNAHSAAKYAGVDDSHLMKKLKEGYGVCVVKGKMFVLVGI